MTSKIPNKTTNKFSPEVRQRAVWMVLDHEGDPASRWTTISSIAAKIGCAAHTLLDLVKKAEVDTGQARRRAMGRRQQVESAGAKEPRIPTDKRDFAQGERLFCQF